MLGAAISARFPPRPAAARLAPLPTAAGGVPDRALLRGRVARIRSSPLRVGHCPPCVGVCTYSQLWALRNCNVKKTRRELSRWELRNRATRADTLSKRAVHVQPPQLSTACLRRPQHELREQRQHCTSSSTQIEPSMWAMTSTAVNACVVVLRRIGPSRTAVQLAWRRGGVKPLF